MSGLTDLENPETKICAACGVTFNRSVSPFDWRTRRYCTRLCFLQFKKRKAERRVVSERRAAPEYSAWSALVRRCTNPNNPCYRDYGGRGISVCAEWRSYDRFLLDVGKRPSPKHSIDRIDNNGDYEPGNVRWATQSEQNRNTRRTRYITAFGKTQTLGDWAREVGIAQQTLIARLDYRNWPIELALSLGPKIGRRIRSSKGGLNVGA